MLLVSSSHKDLAHQQQGPALITVFMDCWPIDNGVQLFKEFNQQKIIQEKHRISNSRKPHNS